ncbi:CMF_collapsed_G0013470.mRNA.1.CDS.1 [Saccharomyces cerevisiae]|nr:CMF_collapsed_G0013470.mRNA.1.CDS.1 [Saccharomyces cerevisiae]
MQCAISSERFLLPRLDHISKSRINSSKETSSNSTLRVSILELNPKSPTNDSNEKSSKPSKSMKHPISFWAKNKLATSRTYAEDQSSQVKMKQEKRIGASMLK